MKQIRRFLPLAVILVAVTVFFAMGWNRYLSFESIQEHGEGLKAFVEDNWLLALLLLMLTFAVLTASVTPGVFFLTVLAGYLFGTWVGGVATSFAATVGALAIYGVGRTAARDWLRRKIDGRGGLMARICDRIDKDTFVYVLGARLVVSVPFHLINVAAGVMGAPLKPYLLSTFIGVLPAHLLYCWIGSNLGELSGETDIRSLFARFALPLTGVGILSIGLPLALRAWRNRKAGAAES